MADKPSGYTLKQTGNKLVITVANLTKDVGLSSSGKSDLVASTRGAVDLGDTGIKLNLNLYRPTR